MLRPGSFFFVCVLLLLPATAHAVSIPLTASLDCLQEVPNTCGSTSGTGTATVTFDNASGLLSWNIAWSGLTGPAVGMHFHGPAGNGVNASVQVDIGAISGLTSASIGSTTITAAQASQLLSGLWYINIHTASNLGGEIRGQVVPEPTTLLLVGLGVAGLAALRPRVG